MKPVVWLRSLFGRSWMNDDMEEELRCHVQHRADDLERSGVSRSEAALRALSVDPARLLREE